VTFFHKDDAGRALLKEWGLDYAGLQEDEGEKGAGNVVAAIKKCADGTLEVASRIKIAKDLDAFTSMAPKEVKDGPLVAAIPEFMAAIKAILLSPDDKDVPVSDYEDEGLQYVAKRLATMCASTGRSDPQFAQAAWGPAVEVLDACAAVSCKAPTPLRNNGPAVQRTEAVIELMRTKPMTGGTPPSGMFEMMVKYVTNGGPHAQEATSTVRMVVAANPAVLEGKLGLVFDLVRAGNDSFASVLTGPGAGAASIAKDPAPWEANVDLLLRMDFMMASSLLNALSMAPSGAAALGPHVEWFIAKAESGTILHGMGFMCMNILAGIARSVPGAVFPLLSRCYAFGVATPNADTGLAQILGSCGAAPGVSGAAETAVGLLGKLMVEPTLGPNSMPLVLTEIVNQFGRLGDQNTAVLAPHIDAIRANSAKCGIIVEKIVDWYEGRSLASVDAKVCDSRLPLISTLPSSLFPACLVTAFSFSPALSLT
jgi:hypothetical protein